MPEFLVSIDRTLFLFFNRTISNPVFDSFFVFITQRDSWIIPLAAAAIIFIIREKRRALVVMGLVIIAVAISDPLCVRIIKPLVHRLRPCHPSYFIDGQHLFLAGGHFLFGYKKSLSFPSAHAMNWFAAATVVCFFYPKRVWWFFIPAFLVALSRVYVGVHYPLDIVAGALFGITIGMGVCSIYRFLLKKGIIQKISLRRKQRPDSIQMQIRE